MVIDLACHYQKHIVLRGSVTPGGGGVLTNRLSTHK